MQLRFGKMEVGQLHFAGSSVLWQVRLVVKVRRNRDSLIIWRSACAHVNV